MTKLRRIRARLDAQLVATLGELEPLFYADGGSPREDRPAHVRAASAVRRRGTELVIVQDDTSVLVVRGESGRIEHVLLPATKRGERVFDDTLGNKKRKLDLEACVLLPDGRIVAFGSGSKKKRERLVMLSPDGATQVVDGERLYERLHDPHFAGSELNLEGALVVHGVLRLFQRGNGAPRGELLPINATADLPLDAFLAWLDEPKRKAPELENIAHHDLGMISGVPFGFTDAALAHDGRVAFIASAEGSPDTVRDGEVLGCRFGLIDGDDVRITPVLDEHGAPSKLKLEGLETQLGEPLSFDVVADMDAPAEPATLGKLVVSEKR
jgi:hypothetical protein